MSSPYVIEQTRRGERTYDIYKRDVKMFVSTKV
jgi:hypothetical protein